MAKLTRPDDGRPSPSPRLLRRSDDRVAPESSGNTLSSNQVSHDHRDRDLDSTADPEKNVAETFSPSKAADVNIADLQRMSMKDLLAIAEQEQLTEYHGMKKQDLIFKILKERTRMNGLMFGEGTLEILPDGFGFLRSPDYHYLPCLTTFMSAPARFGGSGCEQGPLWLARFGPPKRTNDTSHCSESKLSTARTPIF